MTKVDVTHFAHFGDRGSLGTCTCPELVFHYVSYYILDTVQLQRVPFCCISDAVDVLLCVSFFLIWWATDYVSTLQIWIANNARRHAYLCERPH
jgi:hypothetical protein